MSQRSKSARSISEDESLSSEDSRESLTHPGGAVTRSRLQSAVALDGVVNHRGAAAAAASGGSTALPRSRSVSGLNLDDTKPPPLEEETDKSEERRVPIMYV
jgi:hypothetical protein